MTLFRTYEQRVDEIVAVCSDRRLPVQVFFLKDGLAIGVVKHNRRNVLAPPGVTPEKGLHAESPEALELLQKILRKTPLGFKPKGLIRAAMRETWRRKFNELQAEKMQEQLRQRDEQQGWTVVSDVNFTEVTSEPDPN